MLNSIWHGSGIGIISGEEYKFAKPLVLSAQGTVFGGDGDNATVVNAAETLIITGAGTVFQTKSLAKFTIDPDGVFIVDFITNDGFCLGG